MGSRVRIRLFRILHFVMHFLFPLLKNSKSGVDDRGHRLRICQAHRRVFLTASSCLRSLLSFGQKWLYREKNYQGYLSYVHAVVKFYDGKIAWSRNQAASGLSTCFAVNIFSCIEDSCLENIGVMIKFLFPIFRLAQTNSH